MPFDIKIASTSEGPKFVTVVPPAERRPGDITFYPDPRTRHLPNFSQMEENMGGIYEQIATKLDQ